MHISDSVITWEVVNRNAADNTILEAVDAAEKLQFYGSAAIFINELRRRWIPNG